MKAIWKSIGGLAILMLLFSLQSANAQLQLPRASQKAHISQTIGLTDISITYSRPAVKGRAVWGELVPYDQVWRTGANESTNIVFTDDVTINGAKLAAGSYSLHTIPNKDEWTIIFNKDDKQFGSFDYDQAKDALRIKVKPQSADFYELLTFDFPVVTANSAEVELRWEKLKVAFTVGVDVINKTLTNARVAIANAKPDDWRTFYQAANFSFDNNVNQEEAERWLEQSIKINGNYYNLSLKAKRFAKVGNYDQAIALGEKAVQVGKESQKKVDTTDTEKLLTQWRSKGK
jgi:hypothetical protein